MTATFYLKQGTCSVLLGLVLLNNFGNSALAAGTSVNAATGNISSKSSANSSTNVNTSSSAKPSSLFADRSAAFAPPETKDPRIEEAKRKQVIFGLWSKYHRCGLDAMKKGDNDAALLMFGRAVEEAELLKYERPELAATFDALSELYKRNGFGQDSLKAGLKAIELRKKFSATGGPQGRIASLVKAGSLYRESGDIQKANESFLEAMRLCASSQSNNANLALALEGLAQLSLAAKDWKQAESYSDKLIRLDEQRAATDLAAAGHLELAAIVDWQQARLAEAGRKLEKALQIRLAKQGPGDPELISCMRNYVRASLTLGRSQGLSKLVSTLLAYDRKNLVPNSSDYLCDIQSLAELKFAAAEFSAAQILCDELQKDEIIASGKDLIAQADLLSLQGRLCAQRKQWHEGRNLAEQAIAARLKLGLPELLSMNDLETIAGVQLVQGQVAEAEMLLQKILQQRRDLLVSDSRTIARIDSLLKSAQEKSSATATASSRTTVAN